MNKLSAIALLGSTKAAIGPAVATTWPKFATLVDATGTSIVNTSTVTAIYSQQADSGTTGTVGITRGYRNDFFVAPTQNNTAATANGAGTAGAIGALVAQTTVSKTWYPTTTAEVGTAMSTAVSSLTVDTAANGARFGVCKTMAAFNNCTAVMTTLGTAASTTSSTYTSKVLKARIVTKQSVTTQAGLDVTATNGDGTSAYQLAFFTWNTDFFMAAMYQAQQPTTAVTDGSAWCSAMDVKMLKAGTAVVLDIAFGFTGRTKCSWQVTGEDGSVGHTFNVTTADTLTSNLKWAEWYGSGALGTNAQLPTTESADFYVGNYAAMTNGAIYANPVTAVTVSTAGRYTPEPTGTPSVVEYLPVVSYTDAITWVAGSIGTLNYFPGMTGDYKDSQTSTIDQMQLQSMYDMYNSQVNTFNSDNSSYETLRKTYDEALTAENARLADALKAAFDPVIAVPTRPCSPTRPGDYSGAYLDLSSTTAYGATQTLMGSRANIKSFLKTSDAKNNLANAEASFKMGVMYVEGTTAALGTSVGHVFGRLGQGSATTSTGSNPFLWMASATATKAGMLVGYYPTTDADTGLLTGKKVEITFKAKTWASLTDFNKPSRPGAPTEPMSAGASMLALGATSALVLATLA